MKICWLPFFALLFIFLPGTTECILLPEQAILPAIGGSQLPVLELKDKQQVYYLGTTIELFREGSTPLDIEQIRSGRYDSLFRPSQDSIPNLGTVGDGVWVRLRLRNRSENSQKKWLLELDNWWCEQLEVYAFTQDSLLMEKRAGRQQLVHEREVQDRNLSLYLDLPHEETVTLLIHVRGASYVPLSIWAESAFYTHTKNWDLVWCFYFGIFFTMILYNLILLFSVRDVSYLFYVGYIFHFAFLQFIQMGYGSLYLFPDQPETFTTYYYYLNGASCLFTLLTARAFLNIPERLPAFDMPFKLFMGLSILMMPLGLLRQDHFLLQFAWLIPFTQTFFLLGAGIVVLARGFSPARYFIIGWLLLAVSVILYFLKSIGLVPINFFTQYGVRVASALEVILFSLGLADRINVIKKEKEQAFRKLEDSKREAVQLQEMDKLKSKFFANISHEFRTPLTLILAPLQDLIAKTSVQHPHFLSLQSIQQQAQQLLLLINQLLDFARLEAGALRLQAARLEVNTFVKQVSSSFSVLAESRQITLHLELEAAQEASPFYADADKLQQVLMNLISNAFKFTTAGGRIHISTHSFLPGEHPHWPQGYVTISVKDTGQGMLPEQLERIFNRFYQADQPAAKLGSGIGLALSKELVELHRGAIEVTSTAGHGSCFTIFLPLGAAHLSAEERREGEAVPPPAQGAQEVVQACLSEEKPVTTPAANTSTAAPSLLIVEDNTSLRSFICSIFQQHYRILEAENGREAYALALHQHPDLIVSDLMMPEVDGIQLCQMLKNNPLTCNIPFLLLTARGTDSNKLEGLQSGADDYLIKPFDSYELQLRVHNLIKSRQNLLQEGLQQLEKVRLETFVHAQEQERTKIASDLHDSVGQMLALVRINLARIDAALMPATIQVNPEVQTPQIERTGVLEVDSCAADTAEMVHETLQLLDDTCTELRRISHNMMSPELTTIPLEEALRILLWKMLKEQPVTHQLEVYGLPDLLPSFIKINLYRIVQEAVSNIVRHAAASKVVVQLIGLEDELNLLIEDNGNGFVPRENESGIGLRNIRSRVALMKGSLEVDSSLQRGTIINISVPTEVS